VLDVSGVLTREASEAEPEPPPGAARAESAMRVARGGSWYHTLPAGRAATRYVYFASARFSTVGLRLVCEL
jgi:formylglycine-generating enzyme required for sulfatase activity